MKTGSGNVAVRFIAVILLIAMAFSTGCARADDGSYTIKGEDGKTYKVSSDGSIEGDFSLPAEMNATIEQLFGEKNPGNAVPVPNPAPDDELVSKRMADAMSSGRYYMKFTARIKDEETGMVTEVKARVAADDGVTMERMESYNITTLTANGYVYTLSETAKTYSSEPVDEYEIPDKVNLIFTEQGTCLLGNVKYYYDKYSVEGTGNYFTFYYNSDYITAIDLGEGSPGIFSLLDFDTRIPDDMYFCLPENWKYSQYSGIDMSAYLGGVDLSGMLGGLNLEDIIGSAELPEGFDLNDLYGGLGGTEVYPAPPRGVTVKDTSASHPLAAGLRLTDTTPSGAKAHDLPEYVYRSSFAGGTRFSIDLSTEVTEEGILEALSQIAEETKGMDEQQATDHIIRYSGEMLTCIEIGCVTGDIIERAVASCLVCPNSALYNNTATLYFYLGQTERALEYFREADAMDGDNAVILTNIGQCFFELGSYSEAKSYAERATRLESDYGLAWQLLTSLYLKEGNSILATETLFKSAKSCFNDLTAVQFYSLNSSLQKGCATLSQQGKAKELLDSVMNQVNLGLLTEATKRGFSSDGSDTAANAKTFDFPVNPSGLRRRYKAYNGKLNDFEKVQTKLHDTVDSLTTLTVIPVYLTMGMQGDNSAAASSYQIFSDWYKNGEDGSYLLDARQFWCLYTWQTYYRMLCDYENGNWSWCDGDGVLHGDYTAAYAARIERYKSNEEIFDRAYKTYIRDIIELGIRYEPLFQAAKTEKEQKAVRLAQLRDTLPINKNLYKAYEACKEGNQNAEKSFYTSSIKPLLEEYWLKMNAMASYADSDDVQQYFLTLTMIQINDQHQREALINAGLDGKFLADLYDGLVSALERQIGIEQSEYEQLPADTPEPVKKAYLKEYGKKKTWNLGLGVNTPFGRVGLSRRDGQYSFSFESKLTGTTSIKNLSTGESTTITTMETLAQPPKPSSQKGIFGVITDYLTGKASGKLADSALGLANVKDGGKFLPRASSERGTLSMRTIDSQGNTTDTGSATFSRRSFGVGDVGAEVTKTTTRVGGITRTTHQMRLGFKFVDFEIGR